MSLRKIVALISYIFINVLFVFKYGSRQHYISTFLLIIIYISLVLGIIYLFKKLEAYINTLKNFQLFFWIFSIIISSLILLVILSVNKNELNTDRWSALSVAIDSLLHLKYPYTAIDHLGGRSSGLPGLFLIGIPFYLIGNIGLLQLFIFIGILYFLSKSQLNNSKKALALFLLLISPAYLWEVYVASDLMSNIIIIILFMFYWAKKFPLNYLKKPIVLGLILAILIFTRGVVIIPLAIFLFSTFYNSKINDKLKLSISFFLMATLLILPIVSLSPNFKTLSDYNPFQLQTRQTSLILQILVVLFSFMISFKVKNITQTINWSLITLGFLMLITMVNFFFNYGIYQSIIKDIFDISYLGILIPFTILSVILDENTDRKKYIPV